MSIRQRPLFVRQAERCVSLKRRCYVVCTCGACFQRFKVSPLRCFRVSSHLRCCFKVPGFTASLFQSFIAPAVLFQSSRFHRLAVSMFHNSSPSGTQNKPRLRLFAFKSGSPEQTKILSVCYGEKRRYELLFNDRAERYRSCNLVTERAVVERASYSSHISLISQISTTLFAHLQKNAYLCAFSI